MHGSKAMAQSLLAEMLPIEKGLSGVDIAVCPPLVYIETVKTLLGDSRIRVGGQNLADATGQGAFTGEVSGEMLKDMGCDVVIVGHSERRSIYKETNAVVAQKVAVALEQGLTPILCVGETLEERETNITEQVVATQINAVVDKVGVDAFKSIVIAYEPVWAIGTGKTATPEQAQAVHAFIRGLIAKQNPTIAEALIIQYGGSMKPENAQELLSQPDIDGGLIGGASLQAEDFMAICRAAGESCSK